MSLSPPGEPDGETHREPPPQPAPSNAAHTSLESLVHLLQGSSRPNLADVGITTLPHAHLDRLCSSARQEAELCQDRSDLFLELLECCVEHNATPAPDMLLRMTQQLLRLGRDQRRWHDLADNAAYYRDNVQVAARISSYLFPPDRCA